MNIYGTGQAELFGAGYPVTGYGIKKTEKSTAQSAFLDYLSAEDIEKQKEVTQEKKAADYWEREFAQVGANAPASVKQAWMEAAAAVGTDGMGIGRNGMLSHISQLMVRRIQKNLQGENAHDLLGSSVQSAMRVTGEALYALEHPLVPRQNETLEVARAREREKLFYQEFLGRLQELCA
ncbi:MAG: hypothetical protein NC314_03390 [Roseburia sp.]|nr:hypothetical protein [Roseburia sp.]MCM1241858.1 hypothetical protein [Roseburia sp.]